MAGHLCQALFGDIGRDSGLSAVAPSIFRYALSYAKVYPSSDSVMIPQNTTLIPTQRTYGAGFAPNHRNAFQLLTIIEICIIFAILLYVI